MLDRTTVVMASQLPDRFCCQLEQNNSNSRQGCHGHGQLPDRESAEEKNNNARQNYCGYGQLPDLVCSQFHYKLP